MRHLPKATQPESGTAGIGTHICWAQNCSLKRAPFLLCPPPPTFLASQFSSAQIPRHDDTPGQGGKPSGSPGRGEERWQHSPSGWAGSGRELVANPEPLQSCLQREEAEGPGGPRLVEPKMEKLQGSQFHLNCGLLGQEGSIPYL